MAGTGETVRRAQSLCVPAGVVIDASGKIGDVEKFETPTHRHLAKLTRSGRVLSRKDATLAGKLTKRVRVIPTVRHSPFEHTRVDFRSAKQDRRHTKQQTDEKVTIRVPASHVWPGKIQCGSQAGLFKAQVMGQSRKVRRSCDYPYSDGRFKFNTNCVARSISMSRGGNNGTTFDCPAKVALRTSPTSVFFGARAVNSLKAWPPDLQTQLLVRDHTENGYLRRISTTA